MTKFKDRYNYRLIKFGRFLSFIVANCGFVIICCYLLGTDLKEPQEYKILECYTENSENRCILWNTSSKKEVLNKEVSIPEYKQYSLKTGSVVERLITPEWAYSPAALVFSFWIIFIVWRIIEFIEG